MPRLDPEAEARQQIDRQLEKCGWAAQDRRDMNISAALGVAIREFSLTTGGADYMLYADGRAIGVVEVKPVGHALRGRIAIGHMCGWPTMVEPLFVS